MAADITAALAVIAKAAGVDAADITTVRYYAHSHKVDVITKGGVVTVDTTVKRKPAAPKTQQAKEGS